MGLDLALLSRPFPAGYFSVDLERETKGKLNREFFKQYSDGESRGQKFPRGN
jgi:hypothetical protein